MIVLEKYRMFEKLLGLHPLGGRKHIYVRISYFVTFISFNLMELTFIILNIHEGIEKVASALSPIFVVPSSVACYAHFLINRDRYNSLLNEMQDIVDESKYFKSFCEV